jgi:hypothetical protein
VARCANSIDCLATPWMGPMVDSEARATLVTDCRKRGAIVFGKNARPMFQSPANLQLADRFSPQLIPHIRCAICGIGSGTSPR